MRLHNNMTQPLYRYVSALVVLLLVGCSDGLSRLERIQDRGKLRVAITATPPLYFPNESQIQGFDHDIISSYATSIGVKLEFIRANTVSDIITLLKQGKAHIGIAGSMPAYPDDAIRIGSAYNNNTWYVVGNRNDKLPKSIDAIKPGEIIVAEGSRPALVLSRLKQTQTSLLWLELPNANSRQVLEQLNLNNFGLSVIDADVYTYYRYLYPEIKIAFSLNEQYPSHWLSSKDDDVSLFNSMNDFIQTYKGNGNLEQQYDVYFKHLNVFNYVDSLYYVKRIQITLPKYIDFFKQAAIETEFDERFLASISYQESHWDEKARSHTGVRGLMMLTQDTAKRIGVKNRLDPEESIMGGAKYLQILKQSLPERINEPDRSWMTLAAYNIGLGHLEDARILTQASNDNPDRWNDVQKHLPKLSQKKWYEKTRHGYARGHEPVEFVRRIRRYYDILRLYQQEELLEKLDSPLELDNLKINSPVF